jgi:hypothetical protein
MWMAVVTYPQTISLSHTAFPALMSFVKIVGVTEAVKGGRFTMVPGACEIVL